MATNSTTPGYLLPGATSAPIYGDDLDDVFHDVLQGILGFPDGSLIRPRWQPEPPNQPDFTENWVAFGLTTTRADVFPYISLDPAGNQILERDEEISALHSFYGPGGQALSSMYNDGIQIEQNRDALTALGIKLIECQEVTTAPALIKERWMKRYDCKVIFRRRLRRVYPVGSVFGSKVHLDNEHYITIIDPSTPN